MARTSSNMLPLGTVAPDFNLPEPGGRTWKLGDFADAKALLVMFICNHCPYVVLVADELARLGREAMAKGVAVVAISANDVESHPADGPEQMIAEKAARGYPFPYLYDQSQAVAKAYRAACTPDFFLFDQQRKLVYRGQLDGARPGNGVAVTGVDLRKAIDEVLASKTPSPDQKPSIGCNIKWKDGIAPSY